MRHVTRRLINSVLLLVGVSLLSFLFIGLVPGDYFKQMRLNPQTSLETIDRIRSRFGLDRSLPARYFAWLRSALRGDFGFSFAYGSPVGPLLFLRARNTLLLTGLAMFISWLVSVPVGVWAASRRGKVFDHLCSAGTTTLLALPDLLLALVLLWIAMRTRWFPMGGMRSVGYAELGAWHKLLDTVAHLFLPVAALVLSTAPMLIRHARSAMVEVLDAPFIRFARGRGIPHRRLLFRHALPAAANPLVSLFGLSVGTLLSASVLVEVIMSWPGLGPLLLESILARDPYVVLDAVMFSTLFLVAGGFLTDLLLYIVDPRIRRS